MSLSIENPKVKGTIIGLIILGGIVAAGFLWADVTKANDPRQFLWKPKDFTLQDINNKPVNFASSNGTIRLVTFFYASCPDGCSVITTKLNNVYTDLQKKSKVNDLTFFEIDFDYYDNLTTVRNYVNQTMGTLNLPSNFHVLLGNHTQIDKITKDWNFVFFPINQTTTTTKTAGTIPSEYTPNHGGNMSHMTHRLWAHQFLVYVVDQAGSIQKIYNGLDWKNSDMIGFIDYLRSVSP